MWGWGWVKVYVPNDKPVVRRQLVRVSSLCESQGLNSGCWAWWQNPFLAVPFCQLSSFERAEKKSFFCPSSSHVPDEHKSCALRHPGGKRGTFRCISRG